MWRQQIKDKNWYFLYYKKETAFNLFGVVVYYCRVFPLSIANLSTKLDAGERERKWVESISGLTALTGHCLEMNPSEKRFFNNLYQKKRQLYLTKWTIVSNIIMWLMTYICTTKGCSNTRCTKMYNISQFFLLPRRSLLIFCNIWTRPCGGGNFDLRQNKNCSKWEENPENILKGEREYNTRQESSIDLNDASIKMNISINWSSAAFLELWEKGESYLATSSMVAGIGLSFVSARKHTYIYSIFWGLRDITWGLGIEFHLGE